MGDRKELGKAFEEVLKEMLGGIKDVDMKDLEVYARQIALDAVEVASHGFRRAPQELLAQALMVAEISRIRLTNQMKDRLLTAIQTAVGILVKAL